MLTLLSEAGRSFLRAFLGTLLVLLPGVLSAPNLGAMRGLAVAALIASVAAGLKAVQVFIPRLSFTSFVRNTFLAQILNSFTRAFLAALVILLPGVLDAPDLNGARGLLVAAIIAAVTAGVRALQGVFTEGESPSPRTGF